MTRPQTASIVAAYIQFTAADGSSSTADLEIDGHKVNHSINFKSKGKKGISNRPKTSASVNWQPANWSKNARGSDQQTPDLADIVQEIVDRGKWKEGYAMSFIITGKGSREAYSYDGCYKNKNRAPQLVIKYASNVTGNDPEDLTEGYYTVRVKDKNGCAASTSITLTEPSKGSGAVLAEKESMIDANGNETTEVSLEISPNPVSEFATVRFQLEQEAQAVVRVLDMAGRTLETVYTGNVPSAQQVQVQTSLDGLRSGMYQIVVTTSDGKQTVKRFVIAR